jgi:hypothetical protein
VLRLGAPNTRPTSRSPLTTVILIAERFVDAPPGDRSLAAKLRPGYANFAIAELPLKLILMENPGQGCSLNHLGVEVASTDAVDAEQTRLASAGLLRAR